jgi:hypothetical protein
LSFNDSCGRNRPEDGADLRKVYHIEVHTMEKFEKVRVHMSYTIVRTMQSSDIGLSSQDSMLLMVKLTLEQATKTTRGSRDISVSFFNLGAN